MKARIPADVDMVDRIFAGLTARQLAILGAHVLALWALWLGIGKSMPPYAFGALALPVAAFGLLWATSTVEGTTLERILGAAVRHFARPRRRVLSPEGVPELPRWWGPRAAGLASVALPVERLAQEGHVELGDEGLAIACRASSLNFALRSEREQRALVEGFGRLLNALEAPAQLLVRSERADLRVLIDSIEERAPALPHPALEEAAREHAEFLRSLASRRDVLSRQVLVCLREQGNPEGARARLERRAEEASALLRGLGVRLDRLDAGETAALLARASDPEAALPVVGLSLPGEVVTAAW